MNQNEINTIAIILSWFIIIITWYTLRTIKIRRIKKFKGMYEKYKEKYSNKYRLVYSEYSESYIIQELHRNGWRHYNFYVDIGEVSCPEEFFVITMMKLEHKEKNL